MPDIEVAGLVTKLSIDDSELEQSMAGLNRSMNVAKSQLAVASSGLNQYGNSTAALRMKSDALSKQLQVQGTRVAKLQQEHAKAVQEKGRDAKETQNLEVRLNRAVAEYNKLDSQLRATNQQLATQTSYWTKLGGALDSAGSKLQSAGKNMQSAGRTLSTHVTAPIIAAGATIVKFGADFERSMVQSTAIMGNLSDEMRKDLELAAREVAKTTRFSATQAAESYFFLASAGLDAAQSIQALPKVAAFAQAGNFDMARATDLLTDAQSALGLSVDDTTKNMENMARVSDVLVKANVLANANVQQFSEALTNKAGAALRLLNKDVEEGVAVLAAFADQGKKGTAAGESLNIVLRDLQRASIKNREEFDKFNVKVYDTRGNMRNVADIIQDLEKALAGMSDEQLRSTLMMMGFQDESVANIQALLGTSDAIREYESALRSAGGTTQEIADKQIKNLWDQLALLKDKGIDALITAYQTLEPTIQNVVIPAFEKLIENVTKAAEWFASLDEGTQRTILQFAGFAAAAGPALIVTGKLSVGLGAIAKTAGLASKALGIKAGLAAAASTAGAATTTAAGGAVALKAGLLGVLGPAGLAVGAIAGIGYAGYKTYQYMKQDAIPGIREFGDTVSETTAQSVNDFMGLHDGAMSALQRLKWSGGAVTEEMASTISTNVGTMSAQIIDSLEKSRDEGLSAVEQLFKGSTKISEEEQAEIIANVEQGYTDRIALIEEQKARIQEIMDEASKDRRDLTLEEQGEVYKIMAEMKNTAIATMSENELEQRAILERMAADGEAYSARQAADVVKNSKEQTDGAIDEAEKQYHEVLKQIVFLRDDAKTITKEQADDLIKEAQRQRDGVVSSAEEMHDLVVAAAKLQAGEHLESVDWETGEVLKKWDIFKRDLKRIWDSISRPNYAMPSATNIPSLGFGGSFGEGGVVPGPIGAPRMILAHAGETILPTHKPGNQSTQRVIHSGTITHRGVNNQGELVAYVKQEIMDDIRREVR